MSLGGVPVPHFIVRLTVGFLALAALLCALSTGTSSAATGMNQLRTCSETRQVFGTPDGSTLVFGLNHDVCIGSATSGSWGDRFIIKLRPDGSLDRNFASGGMGVYGPNQNLEGYAGLFPLSDGRMILVSDNDVTRINADGSIDRSYASDGVLSDLPLHQFPYTWAGIARISAAALKPDGSIVLGGGGFDGGPELALVDPSGQVDDSFGTDGLFTLNHFAAPAANVVDQLTVDSQGAVTFGGWAYTLINNGESSRHDLYAARVTPDGQSDPGFGAGDGVATFPSVGCGTGGGCPNMVLNGIITSDSGTTRMYGSTILTRSDQYETQCFVPRVIRFDSSGNLVSSESTSTSGCPNVNIWDALPDGRYAASTFRLGNQKNGDYMRDFGVGATSLSTVGPFTDFKTFGNYARVNDVTYDPFTDQLVGVADLDSISVVRVSPDGDPVADFGNAGMVTLPGDRCRTSPDGPFVDPTPTAPSTCVISRPSIAASGRLTRGRSHSPGFRFRITMKKPPVSPKGLVQKIELKVPEALGARRGKMAKRLFARVDSAQHGKTSIRFHGRSLELAYRPVRRLEEPNAPVTVTLGVRPGGLKTIARGSREKRLHFRITGSYEPGPQSIYRRSQSSVTVLVPRAG